MKLIYSLFFFILTFNDFIFSYENELRHDQEKNLDNYNSETLIRNRRKSKNSQGTSNKGKGSKASSETTTSKPNDASTTAVGEQEKCPGGWFNWKTYWCWVKQGAKKVKDTVKNILKKKPSKKQSTTTKAPDHNSTNQSKGAQKKKHKKE
uniref:Uncharacterized protein n=1 Tax=Strongyloides venezuelensis TaxID=75913 RepID=A0A0K0FTU0_STRVS